MRKTKQIGQLDLGWWSDIPAPQWYRWFRLWYEKSPKPRASWDSRCYVWIIKLFLYKRTVWVAWYDRNYLAKKLERAGSRPGRGTEEE